MDKEKHLLDIRAILGIEREWENVPAEEVFDKIRMFLPETNWESLVRLVREAARRIITARPELAVIETPKTVAADFIECAEPESLVRIAQHGIDEWMGHLNDLASDAGIDVDALAQEVLKQLQKIRDRN